jgi:hypothetical protein
MKNILWRVFHPWGGSEKKNIFTHDIKQNKELDEVKNILLLNGESFERAMDIALECLNKKLVSEPDYMDIVINLSFFNIPEKATGLFTTKKIVPLNNKFTLSSELTVNLFANLSVDDIANCLIESEQVRANFISTYDTKISVFMNVISFLDTQGRSLPLEVHHHLTQLVVSGFFDMFACEYASATTIGVSKNQALIPLISASKSNLSAATVVLMCRYLLRTLDQITTNTSVKFRITLLGIDERFSELLPLIALWSKRKNTSLILCCRYLSVYQRSKTQPFLSELLSNSDVTYLLPSRYEVALPNELSEIKPILKTLKKGNVIKLKKIGTPEQQILCIPAKSNSYIRGI